MMQVVQMIPCRQARKPLYHLLTCDSRKLWDAMCCQDEFKLLCPDLCMIIYRACLHMYLNSIFLLFFVARFSPTIPHCSMATLIGLSIRVKLLQSLPSRFKVKVSIQPGTHASENAVNKQLADKERVSAALENSHLLGVVNKCIMSGMRSEV